jgi:hypothetical protein
VELLSINGQELRRWNNNFTEIQLSGYSKGVYLLWIKTGKGTDVHKLVIE